MGSLRQQHHKRFFLNRFSYLGFLFLLTVGLVGCLPATQGNHLEFFFSEKVWGGSPFAEAQKKQLFVEALKNRTIKSISEPIPFEVNDPSVIIKRFDALYEVDAILGLPEVRSGYVLELTLPASPPERVTLTNTLTGVSWSIKLSPVNSGSVTMNNN